MVEHARYYWLMLAETPTSYLHEGYPQGKTGLRERLLSITGRIGLVSDAGTGTSNRYSSGVLVDPPTTDSGGNRFFQFKDLDETRSYAQSGEWLASSGSFSALLVGFLAISIAMCLIGCRSQASKKAAATDESPTEDPPDVKPESPNVVSLDPQDWYILYSAQMPSHPSSDSEGAWSFEFPSSQDGGHVNYEQTPFNATGTPSSIRYYIRYRERGRMLASITLAHKTTKRSRSPCL
jgi:hypothetical protein